MAVANELVLAIGIGASIAAYLSKSFVLEPLLRYRVVTGRIQNRMKYYANVLTNSGSHGAKEAEARDAMRVLSCDLEEACYGIGLRRALGWLRLLPPLRAINEAASRLIYLSNAGATAGREVDNAEAMEKVRAALKLLP